MEIVKLEIKEDKRPKKFREKFIRIKRHWKREDFEITLVKRADGEVVEIPPDESLMIGGMDDEMVFVDITIEDFEARLVEVMTQEILLDEHLEKIKELRWTFKEESLKRIVGDIARDVVGKITKTGFKEAIAEIKKIPRHVI
jgi:hypothetical protein